MKNIRTYLNLMILTTILSGQIVWNEPSYTIWYSFQQRYVEVILPTPQNLVASSINNNQVKLTWDTYWTSELINAYTIKFGYVPLPNRYSFYRNGQALTGGTIEYIDETTIIGQTYTYNYMASDKNYQTVGGMQHWSPRSLPATITVESTLSCPSNFIGYYDPNNAMIILSWDYVKDSNSYIIYKSYINPTTNKWVYLSILVDNTNKYEDVELIKNQYYIYQMIAINGNINSDRTPAIEVTSGTLSIEEDKYWESVEEYEEDRKHGWFGCSQN